MTADLKVVRRRDILQLVLNVAAQQVFGSSTLHAEEVMMVAPVAELIMQIAVFQQHPAEHSGLYQKLEGAVHRGPSYTGQLVPQLLGGEVSLLLGNGPNYRTPG